MENIVHLDLFEQMPSSMKHIYLAYSATGGAIYENYTTSKFKYFYGCFAVFYHLSISLASVMTILQQASNIPVIGNCLMYLFSMSIFVSKAVLVFLKRDNFRALFDQICSLEDHKFIKSNFHFTTDELDEIDVENLSIKIIKLDVILVLAMHVIQLSQKFLTYMLAEEFSIDYQWDFLIPFPSVDSQTFTSYISINCIVFIITLFTPISLYGSVFPTIPIPIQMKNQAIRLLNDMKYHTDLTFQCMEECDKREEEVIAETTKCEHVRKFQLRDIRRQRDRHIDELMHKVRQWIKYHQRWISCVNSFKKCVPHILGIQVVTSYGAIIGTGYNVSKIILDSKETGYDNVLHLLLSIGSLFMTCAFINVLPEMSDDISTAIYSMPWYYLSIKDQKVLLQFLALAQNSPTISVFNAFPLSLEKFPKLLNDAYGYIQLTRVLELKIKSRY